MPDLATQINLKPAAAREDEVSCPQCRRSDAIIKISSIVASGTATETSYVQGTPGKFGVVNGKWAYLEGEPGRYGSSTYRTDLASDLSRPIPPKDTSGGCGCAATGFWIFVALSWLGFLVNGRQPNNPASPELIVAYMIVISVLAVFIGMRAGPADEEARQRHNIAYMQYEKACAWWDSAYYCGRDDVVFTRGGERAVDRSQVQALLAQMLASS